VLCFYVIIFFNHLLYCTIMWRQSFGRSRTDLTVFLYGIVYTSFCLYAWNSAY